MSDLKKCPVCGYEKAYFNGTVNTCPVCGYEWDEAGETGSKAAHDSDMESND